MMNATEYGSLRKAVEDTFISLYIVDVGSLTKEQRISHQEALGVAYLAVTRLENKRFSDLSDVAKGKLDALLPRALQLQQQLAGLVKVTQTLQIVANALDVLTSIAKLVK